MIRPVAALTLALSCASSGHAQERTPSHCVALANAAPGIEFVQHASFGDPLADETARLTYLDHATFLLETRGGLSVITDYTGYVGARDLVPTVATMNNAHSTHWTGTPDPRIPHVLQGWATNGKAADHYLDLGEMLIRNVPTDVRGRTFDPEAQPRANGNSIFVFEVAGLCIGHLGHLHHEPSPVQYATLGRMDVVMAPVDGGYTMDQAAMARVVTRLRSRVIVPMHWFDAGTLAAFLAGMQSGFPIEYRDEPDIDLSLATLPDRPTIIVLTPHWLD